MPILAPRKAPALKGATRRGHYRTVAGLPADPVAAGGGGGGGTTDTGITQLTGDVTAGPGDGSQVATIANDAVTTAKILAANVTTVKIADANVTTAKIADANVTTAKIADANVTTAKVADAAVTSAKLRDSAACSVIGRSANSSGVPADIAAASNGLVLQRLANVLGFSALDITAIADGSITLAKLVDLAALSVLGRASNTSGVMAAITAANDAEVLRRSGTAIGFGQVVAGGIASDAVITAKILDANVTTAKIADANVTTAKILDANVTLAKLANLATQNVIGRNTAGTGVPEAVTLTQLLDWISASVTKGDILVRDTSSWIRLAAPATGYFLGGNGAGALPSYQTPFGFASPLANAFHFDYGPSPANSWKSNRGDSSTATGTTIGMPAAASILASGPYYQLGTAASNNSTAQMTAFTSGSFRELAFNWDFDLTFVVVTDASAITSVRYMIGMGTNNESTDSVAANWIGFRYSTAVPDGGWVGVTYDGTQAVTGTVASIAANTRYVLRIRKVSGTVFFSVNGGAEVSTSTHVPTNNAYAGVGLRAVALTTSVRSLWVGRFWCDYGV